MAGPSRKESSVGMYRNGINSTGYFYNIKPGKRHHDYSSIKSFLRICSVSSGNMPDFTGINRPFKDAAVPQHLLDLYCFRGIRSPNESGSCRLRVFFFMYASSCQSVPAGQGIAATVMSGGATGNGSFRAGQF
ncbi:MAG: hypothetical protein Q7U51_03935 [Methanoregula sp.]|nr:hypothetical protein [Methanoregula sp.]